MDGRPRSSGRRLRCAAAALALSAACAVTVTVPPSGEECFIEVLAAGERLSGSFEVLTGGMRDVDAILYSATGSAAYAVTRQSRGSFSTTAPSAGAVRLCFSNRLSSLSEKSVAFSMHRGGIDAGGGGGGGATAEPARREHVSALDREVSMLSSAVSVIEDEQRYMWARERAARDLNEATNASVMRFSLLELLTMVLVGAGQVWAMKSYFERTNKF